MKIIPVQDDGLREIWGTGELGTTRLRGRRLAKVISRAFVQTQGVVLSLIGAEPPLGVGPLSQRVISHSFRSSAHD